MHLNYSELEFDKDGRPEQPELILQTMGDDIIGTIPGVHNLKMNIKFSEPSTIKFDVAAKLEDGEDNWIYNSLTGYKVIYTDKYGIYLVTGVTTEGDGISEVKHIECNSIEYTLNTKKFFVEEGTFRFCDLTDVTNEDTIIGRILEVAKGWSIGYVSSTLAQKYRTFEQYDEYLLSFMYGDAKDKYHCIFVFDPYERTISAYDADEETSPLPIYLDFDNLVTEVEVEELTNELVTAIRPYGADELSIVDVNPIGSNWIYDLSYFIENGDIPAELATKWTTWQTSVSNNQEYYKALVSLQNSATSELLAAQVALTELKGELETLQAQQSVTIQALALETTAAGKRTRQQQLDSINSLIASKEERIVNQEGLIESIQDELDPENEGSYANKIRALVNSLSFINNFTAEECEILSKYFIEQDLTEETFVASSVEATTTGQSYPLANTIISIANSTIPVIPLTSNSEIGSTPNTIKKWVYVINGGTFSVTQSQDFSITCEIISGTLEIEWDNILVGTPMPFVLSLYGGTISSGTATAQSGTIIVTGTYTGTTDDAIDIDTPGSFIDLVVDAGSLYLTSNVSDYQKYSVQTELYNFATSTLSDLATPTYEFSVDSGNFLFTQEFEPFRNELRLGRGIYLNLGHDHVITPNIIEFELDFEDYSKFSMVFSNRFKRYDQVNTLKDMVEKSYSYSRSFDASKHIYNQSVSQSSAVSKYMQDALDSAVNTIIGASNQSVIINGAGIHVSGPVASGDDASAVEDFQLRIVNGMIAMTKDNWATADLAIGVFKTDSGYHFGVNAEVIGGNLIVGNELIIEAPQVDQQGQPTGVMQFKVDGSGAWLNNSTFVLQSDANNGGKIIIDPQYGILAGTSNLYSINGTAVTPSFIDNNGDVVIGNDGMPSNTNFYLDINTGNAYFRGTVYAGSGEIGGWTLADDYLYSGSGSTYVALNASATNTNSTYAIWAGAAAPGSAPFSVTKAGKLKATNVEVTGGTISIGNNFSVDNTGSITANSGTFKGTLDAAHVKGNLTADSSNGGAIIGCSINVGNGNFLVDSSGNVTMAGSINMSSGSITWGSGNSPTLVLYARTALSNPKTLYPNRSYSDFPADGTSSNGWHRNMSATYDKYASYTYDGGNSWTDAIKVVGTDGVDGVDGEDGSDATVNATNVFNVLTSGGTKFGIFNDSTSSRLYINASYIKSGIIDADLVSLASGSYGGFACASGSDGTGTTTGAKMYGSNSNYYVFCSGSGVRMQATSSNYFYITSDSSHVKVGITTDSDRRVKNSFDYDISKFEDFYMALRPLRFKYNDIETDRYHFGFIAQEVESALCSSNLSIEDFAALAKTPVQSIGEDGIDDYHYGLGYSEFVALNTHMIQKLYREVESLRAQVQELQEAV